MGIIIDDLTYQKNKTRETRGKYYEEAYRIFVQLFIESTNFAYGPDDTRRAIIKTTKLTISIKEFDHFFNFSADPNDSLILPPYSSLSNNSEDNLLNSLERLYGLFLSKGRGNKPTGNYILGTVC